MLLLLIILAAVIAMIILVAINIVPICMTLFTIGCILIIASPPKHGSHS